MPVKKITDSQKKKIFGYLAKGWESSRIAAKLSLTTQQVAAIKAHKTMGTYS